MSDMTRKEAKEIFLNRGFIDGIYDGNKWREACIVISKWLEQEPFINKPCVSDKQCEHDKNVVLDKIRTEIDELDALRFSSGERIYKDEVLDIIDKYKEKNNAGQ